MVEGQSQALASDLLDLHDEKHTPLPLYVHDRPVRMSTDLVAQAEADDDADDVADKDDEETARPEDYADAPEDIFPLLQGLPPPALLGLPCQGHEIQMSSHAGKFSIHI